MTDEIQLQRSERSVGKRTEKSIYYFQRTASPNKRDGKYVVVDCLLHRDMTCSFLFHADTPFHRSSAGSAYRALTEFMVFCADPRQHRLRARTEPRSASLMSSDKILHPYPIIRDRIAAHYLIIRSGIRLFVLPCNKVHRDRVPAQSAVKLINTNGKIIKVRDKKDGRADVRERR